MLSQVWSTKTTWGLGMLSIQTTFTPVPSSSDTSASRDLELVGHTGNVQQLPNAPSEVYHIGWVKCREYIFVSVYASTMK